jgi:hypothetical protein
MKVLMRFCLTALATASLCWLGSSALAKDWNAASMHYGRGVHAYFDGQDHAAEKLLSQAIESNPNDPRAYYFRAMSRLRLGQKHEARQDMLAGATVEARAPARYAVGTALERVQGQDRLLLESYRRQARLDEAAHRDQRARTRYEITVDRESEVLRREVEVPMEELLEPAPPRELIKHQPRPAPRDTKPAEALGDPFADDPKPSPGESPTGTPPQPALPVVPPQTDEFSDGPAAEAPIQPVPSVPAEDPASEVDEEDPFGF